MVDMRYNSQCILVFSSTTIIPKKRAHARFCVIETVFLNYLFVTAPSILPFLILKDTSHIFARVGECVTKITHL